MRISQYKSYPGNLQIFSRYAAYRSTIFFSYGNQNQTTILNHPHYGYPKLQMSWQIDYTASFMRDGQQPLDDKAAVFPWPYFDSWLFSNSPAPDTYYDYFTKQSYINSNLYGLKTTSNGGLPGDIYGEYVHTVILYDSFDAPFEKYTVV